MKYTYKCKGTCAVTISLEIDEEKKLHNVQFIGGCDGNHKGIVRLVEGEDAGKVAERLVGTTCGPRPTSCPDQLAKAIEAALAEAV